jgi:hypothetical protein
MFMNGFMRVISLVLGNPEEISHRLYNRIYRDGEEGKGLKAMIRHAGYFAVLQVQELALADS